MRSIPILTYHQIAEAPAKGVPYRSLFVTPAAFGWQMGVLRILGYRGLSLSALQPYLRGEKVGRVVGITFDDGYANNLVNALPVLKKHGFSSTCYVVSGLLGQTNRWDLHTGILASPLMGEQELRAWIGGGQEVGAHTRSHADLHQIDEAASQVEIGGSKSDLESLLGVPVSHFCYPYGRYHPAHIAQVRAAGFASASTTVRGRATAASDPFELPRVPVLRTTTLPVFLLKLFSAYEDRK
jgi:peptidoglycan/xylan/chitin deacetylase (PgdA/CDA1 family)